MYCDFESIHLFRPIVGGTYLQPYSDWSVYRSGDFADGARGGCGLFLRADYDRGLHNWNEYFWL